MSGVVSLENGKYAALFVGAEDYPPVSIRPNGTRLRFVFLFDVLNQSKRDAHSPAVSLLE